MNLAELRELKNTPKEKMREVINSFSLDELHTTRTIRRDITAIQGGSKFYPTEFGKMIDVLMIETAKAAYMSDDGDPLYNYTIIESLARRDVFGIEIPEYIKQLRGWDKVVEAGLA